MFAVCVNGKLFDLLGSRQEPTPWFVRRERMKKKAARITECADAAFAAGDIEKGERLDEAVFRLSSRW